MRVAADPFPSPLKGGRGIDFSLSARQRGGEQRP
jgi:hypothetical protein